MKIKKTVLYVLPLLMFLISCSEYPKILKSPDMKVKLEWAEKLYKKGDYTRAQPLFEQLASYYRGTSVAEDMQYFNAYCYYYMKDYDMATYLFKRFCDEYSGSKRAEECNYMFCLTEYLNSLPVELDQTDSYKCVEDISLFIGLYPDSRYIPSCNSLLDKLRKKLEQKAYNAAYLFYQTEDYKAAAICFTNLIKDYPETEFRQDAEFYIIKSYYTYARNSVETKQTERYRTMIKAYNEYRADLSGSNAKEAARMSEDAQKQIDKLENKTAEVPKK